MKREKLIALVYGWIVILILIFVFSILLTFLIRFTTISEKSITFITLAVGIIALFAGGLIAGIKGKGKGLIIGGLTGLGFTLFIFLIQYLGYDQIFSMKQTVHHLIYFIAAAIGGIVGVNVFMTNEHWTYLNYNVIFKYKIHDQNKKEVNMVK